MFKKIAPLFTFVILAFGFWYIAKNQQQGSTVSATKGWEKFEKVDRKVTSKKAKEEDLFNHHLPTKPQPKRKPAAFKNAMREGRYLEGIGAKKFVSPTEPLEFSNKVSSDWKDKLGHNLTRFQEEGTEVLIKREKGLIYVHKGKGQYREQVLVSYKMPNGLKTSYRAMIDSSNGKILFTFNRQKVEDFRNRPTGLSHPLAR